MENERRSTEEQAIHHSSESNKSNLKSHSQNVRKKIKQYAHPIIQNVNSLED